MAELVMSKVTGSTSVILENVAAEKVFALIDGLAT